MRLSYSIRLSIFSVAFYPTTTAAGEHLNTDISIVIGEHFYLALYATKEQLYPVIYASREYLYPFITTT